MTVTLSALSVSFVILSSTLVFLIFNALCTLNEPIPSNLIRTSFAQKMKDFLIIATICIPLNEKQCTNTTTVSKTESAAVDSPRLLLWLRLLLGKAPLIIKKRRGVSDPGTSTSVSRQE